MKKRHNRLVTLVAIFLASLVIGTSFSVIFHYQGNSVPSTPTGFTPDSSTYQVLFESEGLTSTYVWSVILNGVTESSNSAGNNVYTIAFSEQDGSYSFTIEPPSGFSASPSSGSVAVSGGQVSKTISFSPSSPSAYSVVFSQSTLPSGIDWSVTLNGNTQSSSSGDITFSEPDGSYSFSVGSVSGYTSSPSSGTVSVSGANYYKTISFSKTETSYTLTISSGDGGSISYSGNGGSGTVSAGQSGSISVASGGTVSLDASASSGYEFGSWSYTGSITFDSGGTSSKSIEVTVNAGSSISASFPPVQSSGYSLTISSGDGGSVSYSYSGGSNSVSSGGSTTITVSGGSSVSLSETPSSGYLFWDWTDTGSLSLSSTASSSITVTVNGAGSVTANYAIPVPITISASGLGSSASGSLITVNGNTYTVSDLPFSINLEAGSSCTFSWVLTVSSGSPEEFVWQSSSGLSTEYQGTFTVPSGGGTLAATYSPFYQITFTVNPANDGTVSWSGGGNTASSTQTSYSDNYYYSGQQISISAQQLSSEFEFTGWSTDSGVSLSSTTSSSTTATVIGVGTITADFASLSTTYLITFDASNLPSGNSWSVTLHGDTLSSSSTSISFSEPQGTYQYSVFSPLGYSASPSSGQATVSGDQTITISFTLANWQNSPMFSVSTLSAQMGEVNISGHEVVWSQGLANNPTQFYIVTESSGNTQSEFDQALSHYFGINVPPGYEPAIVLIMDLPLIGDFNAIGGNYSVKTYTADFSDILPSSLFDGYPYLRTTPQGSLQLAITLSASTDYVGFASSLLDLILSLSGIAIDDFSPVAKAQSNMIVDSLVSALDLITASGDITVTDITGSLASDGPLSSYTFLDLYTLSKVLSSSIQVGKLFKTFLDVIYYGQKSILNGLISTATAGIDFIGDYSSISSLVQMSFASASLAAQLFSYIFPQYSSNSLLSAIESGVEDVAGFIDPNGTTIHPNLAINNTTIGYNPNNSTFVTNSTGNYALYIGSSYYFFLKPGYEENTELRMNVVGGNSTVPYYVNTISMNQSGTWTTIAGEAFDGSTPVINMTISTNGSISSSLYVIPEINVKYVNVASYSTSGTVQSNLDLLNVSVKTFLSDGASVDVKGVSIVAGNETIPMYSINGSSFYYTGTFAKNVTYSVYVNSASYSGGYGAFMISQVAPSNVSKTSAQSSYLITFYEHGLKNGLKWGITLGNDTIYSTNGSMRFYVTDGNYTFSVFNVSDYTVNPLAGNITINGQNRTIQVNYTEIQAPLSRTPSVNQLYEYVFIAILLGVVIALAIVMNRRRYK